MKQQYDIAAFIWPAYTGDEPRTRVFWPEGMGEWQSVRDAQSKFPGHRWPRKPLWGYVNEADPSVMEMEIACAAEHGVNVFIYDWYWFDNRPFLEQCLNNGYLKARNNDKVKFYLMWANHTATSQWDKRTSDLQTPIWDGAVSRPVFDTIVHRVIDRYFHHPSYYKIDGKPVFMLFDLPNLIRGLGGVKETLEALDDFRAEVVKAGFPGLELHATVRSRKYMETMVDENTNLLSFINQVGFDAVTIYQFFDLVWMGRPYLEILPDVKTEWDHIEETVNAPFVPHISVGWDANPRYNRLHTNVATDTTPAAIEQGCRMAKEYLETQKRRKTNLITVNSWNEWTEGSYLEPDDINGYGYLEAFKRVFMDEA